MAEQRNESSAAQVQHEECRGGSIMDAVSALDEFQQYVTDLEESANYASWCTGHPAECSAWQTYSKAILAGQTPQPPPMTTPFGKALADVGVLVVGGGTPPPTPPPTPGAAVWSSDVTKAAVRPDSAARIAKLLGSESGQWFFTEVAYGEVTSHDPAAAYPVRAGSVGAMDDPFYVPVGQKGGLSNDQHLSIIDHVDGRWHDLDGCAFTNGKLTSWRFGSSMPIDSINVPHVAGKTNQGATAAMFPLLRGCITPEEIAAGVIPHALVYVSATPGPAPNPYPAPAYVKGYPDDAAHHGHVPLGGRIRLAVDATLPAGATKLEKGVFDALQQFGALCRDQATWTNPGPFTLHGLDLRGGGASIQAWKDAGVALGTTGTLKFGTAIPWSKLEYVEAPPVPL